MPIAVPSPTDRNYWVEQAIERNPQVLAQQAGIEVSRVGVELARAGRLPTVQAFANYQYADSDSELVLVSGYVTSAQVGVSANVPIYTGGSTSASIRQGTFQLESSQYDFESQRRTTIQQVRSLYIQVSNNVETVEARQQAIVSNRSALATRAGYEVGTRNIVDVLNAEQNLYNAIANYAEARYDYVVNLLLRQQEGCSMSRPSKRTRGSRARTSLSYRKVPSPTRISVQWILVHRPLQVLDVRCACLLGDQSMFRKMNGSSTHEKSDSLR